VSMSSEERLQQILDIIIKIDREQATLIERIHGINTNMDWFETRLDAIDRQMKPVTWASQTGSIILWVCALLGGIGTALRLTGKL
jgi:hypothetical protein